MNFEKDDIIRTDDNIILKPEIEFKIPIEGGFGQIIFHKMKEHYDKIIHINTVTNETDTFKSLLSRSIRFALALKAKGVTKDDIICSCINKDLNACIPLIACLFIGAKSVYIDPVSLNYSIDGLLNQTNPKYFIVRPEMLEVIEENLKSRSQKSDFIIYGQSDKYPEFSSFLQNQNETNEKNFEPIFVNDLNEIAFLMLTSGTSDISKLIPISHLMIIYQQFKQVPKKNFDMDLFLLYSKQTNNLLCFYGYNWISVTIALFSALIHSIPQLLCPEFNVDNFWKIFIEYKPNFLILTPHQVNEILRSNRPENADFDYHLIMIITGGKVLKELLLQFRDLFPNAFVIPLYGMTENSADLFTLECFNKYHRYITKMRPDCSGFPHPSYSYKIVDINTEKVLGPNQEGELRIKSKYFMKNYYNSDRKDAFDSDGFFKTGDIAYYDEDYCFFIVDRLKHLIFTEKYKLRPIYMETILLSHPSVDKCVVIGIPNEIKVERPMALIVLKENDKNISPEDLQQFYDSKVDGIYKLRGGIKFVKTIPVTSNDKIARHRALHMVLNGEF